MIRIRPATADDGPAVSALLLDLGYEVSAAAASERLRLLAATGADPVYLALEDETPLGVIALHWAPMLHLPGRGARITTLVVGKRARRRKIGQRLLEHAVAVARDAGCDRLELTSGNQRADAHAFYRANGFAQSSLRFHREV